MLKSHKKQIIFFSSLILSTTCFSIEPIDLLNQSLMEHKASTQEQFRDQRAEMKDGFSTLNAKIDNFGKSLTDKIDGVNKSLNEKFELLMQENKAIREDAKEIRADLSRGTYENRKLFNDYFGIIRAVNDTVTTHTEQIIGLEKKTSQINETVLALSTQQCAQNETVFTHSSQICALNETQLAHGKKIDILEASWMNRFYGSVIENPSLRMGFATLITSIKVGAWGTQPYISAGLYGTSGVLFAQVLWDLFSPTIPEKFSVILPGGLAMGLASSLYATYMHQNRIAPQINLANAGLVITAGAILANLKNIHHSVMNLFTTDEQKKQTGSSSITARADHYWPSPIDH